jgi:DNA polymerase-3 subunit delta
MGRSVFGRTLLVVGPEALLAERAVAETIRRVRTEDADVEVSPIEAGRLDAGKLAEITSPSLFSSRRAAVITELGELATDLHGPVAALAEKPLDELAVVLVHRGGARGKTLLDRVRRSAAETIECAALKPWELPQFVSAEAARAGGAIDSDAARFLVEAVGHDLRSLAAGVAQLLADADGDSVDVAEVRRYFGGRAEVTSFAVADAVLAGRTGAAMEQLRWAMSTGVAPVLVTSALATGVRGLSRLVSAPGGLRESDLARQVGVPPWKLKSMRSQARGWDQAGLATAVQSIAVADAEVKGAADDAEFALEQMVLAVARSRRG